MTTRVQYASGLLTFLPKLAECAALRALVRRRPDSHESVTRAATAATRVAWAATAAAVCRQESKSKEAYLYYYGRSQYSQGTASIAVQCGLFFNKVVNKRAIAHCNILWQKVE